MKDQHPETPDQHELKPAEQHSVLSQLPPPSTIQFNQTPDLKLKKHAKKELTKLRKRYMKALKSIEKIKRDLIKWDAKITAAQKKDERKDLKHVKSKKK